MEDFLLEIGIDPAVVKKFSDEKIDQHVVTQMSDEDLNHIGITSYGDRIRLRTYVANQKLGKTDEQISIIDRIQNKISSKKRGSPKRWLNLCGNRNATRDERRVEIGWLTGENEFDLKQVRTQTGGGTRQVKLTLTHTVNDVRTKALGMFFPEGKSKHRGNLEDYEDIFMANFDHTRVNDDMTIKELYDNSNIKTLRLYLSTIHCKSNIHTSNTEPPSKSPRLVAKTSAETYSHASDDDMTLPDLNEAPQSTTVLPHIDDIDNTPTDIDDLDQYSDLLTFPQQTSTPSSQIYTTDLNSQSPATVSSHVNATPTLSLSIDNDILFGDDISNSSPGFELNDTLKTEEVIVDLHRGHVMIELENFFIQNKNIDMRCKKLKVKMILPNGSVENAEDDGGILRDSLSEYWASFYNLRTVGNSLKIPALSPSIDGARWKAVGKVIVAGYYYQGYFPVELSPSFLQYAVSGHDVPQETLIPEYVSGFLNTEESQLISNLLKSFDEDKMDDLLEFLDDHGVRTRPTPDSFIKIIADLAHKELIQAPTYVADCWRTDMQYLQTYMHHPFGDFSHLQPTFKKTWEAIKFRNQLSATQTIIQGYLKKFLKNIPQQSLQAFLRYCTGADLDLGKSIKVTFTSSQSEFARTPVAHTCGCVLELPDSYGSFVEFRNEFMSMLSAKVWVMDIV